MAQDGKVKKNGFHEESGKGVEKLLRLAMKADSMDNLSVVLITLPNYAHYLQGSPKMPESGLSVSSRKHPILN
jgi:hypothetical protein